MDSERRWIPRRGNGGRRKFGGSCDQLASTPCLGWKFRGGDRGGAQAAAVSARKLAAYLWRLTATTSGGGSGNLRWQYGLFDPHQFQLSKFSTEEATKWDFCNSKDVCNSAMLMKKLPKHIHTHTYNLLDGVKRERIKCKEIRTVNSKLLLDIAEAKLSSKQLISNIEKEKKARELLEGSCNNLVKEIEVNREEIGALISQRKTIQEKAEQERKMLQLTEIWREEQAQMKLVDAKLVLEDKLVEINSVIAVLEAFLRNAKLTNYNPKFPKQVFDLVKQSEDNSEILSEQFKKQSTKKKKKKELSAVKVKTTLSSRNKDTCKKIYTDRNPHVVRAMKGRIEWPREIRPEVLARNLLEAKLESQKMVIRNVLKQRS